LKLCNKLIIPIIALSIILPLASAAFDGWRAFPIRSETEFSRGDIGGEGDQLLQGMARSITNPNIVYLSHDCAHVWRSDDAGHTWKSPLSIGLYGVESQSIEVDPIDPNRILIVQDDAGYTGYFDYRGVYMSTDGGDHFSKVLSGRTYLARNYEHNIAYDPTSVTTIAQTWYVALYDADVSPDQIDIYRSDDAGLTWTKTGTIPAKHSYNIQAHPSDGKIMAGSWQHIAVVKSGVNVTFYINGMNAGSKRLSSARIRNNDQPFSIGYEPNNNRYFNGSVDEVRIYNRSLSAAEISDLNKTNGQSVNTVGLIAYWGFEDKKQIEKTDEDIAFLDRYYDGSSAYNQQDSLNTLMILASMAAEDYCGNGVCGPDEKCSSCRADCGSC
jgi:hypothetical protein